MSEKPKLKYEKPVSIDMGRVAPVLGDVCSVGTGAADCPQGNNNTSIPTCFPSGGSASQCETGATTSGHCLPGTLAGGWCFPTGATPG